MSMGRHEPKYKNHIIIIGNMPSSSHVHDIAKSGFGTGTNELYDR